MEDQALAGAQKKAAREGRIIIFIDESGISERPHRVSTWAPKGQTPVLQYSFNWKQLSAVAGVSFWNIYFKLVQGAVRAPEVVAFLKALRRHLGDRKLLIVWDRLQAHRSRLARVCREPGGCHPPGVPATLCARVEPGRIPLGALEASRIGQLLSQGFRRTDYPCTRQAPANTTPQDAHRSILEAS